MSHTSGDKSFFFLLNKVRVELETAIWCCHEKFESEREAKDEKMTLFLFKLLFFYGIISQFKAHSLDTDHHGKNTTHGKFSI